MAWAAGTTVALSALDLLWGGMITRKPLRCCSDCIVLSGVISDVLAVLVLTPVSLHPLWSSYLSDSHFKKRKLLTKNNSQATTLSTQRIFPRFNPIPAWRENDCTA
jgi:hypothetical protein